MKDLMSKYNGEMGDDMNGGEAEMYGLSRDSTPLATAKP